MGRVVGLQKEHRVVCALGDVEQCRQCVVKGSVSPWWFGGGLAIRDGLDGGLETTEVWERSLGLGIRQGWGRGLGIREGLCLKGDKWRRDAGFRK